MIKLECLRNVARVFSITGKYLRHSQKNENNIVNLKSLWAKELIDHFKINIEIIGTPIHQSAPQILVGNHISYLDIPILIYGYPDISFVCKKEVKKWPIIGKVAVMAETIFVDRDNTSSRTKAKIQITSSLLERNQKIAIFPSGTTSTNYSFRWKKGAFEIAQNNDIWVQPFRIRYKPLRSVAYIDQDNFLVHMYHLFRLKEIEATLEFHEPVKISDSVSECSRWKQWCEE